MSLIKHKTCTQFHWTLKKMMSIHMLFSTCVTQQFLKYYYYKDQAFTVHYITVVLLVLLLCNTALC